MVVTMRILGAFLRPLRRRQTYLNLLYLLLGLPLGLCYYALLLLGLVIAVPLMVVWVGAPLGTPVFLLIIFGVRKVAAFERVMTQRWLKIDIPLPEPLPAVAGFRPWRRFTTYLKAPLLWKNLAYLLARLPSGIFTLFLCIFLLSIGSIRSSLQSVPAGTTPADVQSVPGILTIFFYVILLIIYLHINNGLVFLWARFARYMLGAGQKDVQLAEARRIASEERAKAERAEQVRRELIVNVSHELRTPIASIQGHIESLLATCESSDGQSPPPAVLREYLSIVQREATRLSTLVDDLLALARTEAHELRLNITAVAAGEVVEEVYQSLMPLAWRERQITMLRSVTPGLPPVRADRLRLTQVLLNLVRNAITYTPNGGLVSISLEPADDGQIALSVSDTGIGIFPEDQQRIFERFYRADASRSRSSGGSGLGLAIVHDFVVAMGGTISVESTPGEGSCFRVLLRAIQPARSAPGTSQRAPEPQAQRMAWSSYQPAADHLPGGAVPVKAAPKTRELPQE